MEPGDRVEFEFELAGVMMPTEGYIEETYFWDDVEKDEVKVRTEGAYGKTSIIPKNQVTKIIEENDEYKDETI